MQASDPQTLVCVCQPVAVAVEEGAVTLSEM